MNDDAEFEAFLKGEGDLARRLQGLAQPSPSPSLDAAILGRIRTSMEQQRDVAANDAGEAQAGPRLAPAMGMRWRVPVGIAASVLVGLFATQAYQSNTSRELVTMREQERAADAVLEEKSAPVPTPAAAADSAPAPGLAQAPAMPEQRKPAPEPAAPPPPPPDMPAKRMRAVELDKPRSVTPGLERRAESPGAPPVMTEADVATSPVPPPAAPPMPAPVSAAPAAKPRLAAPTPQAMQEVTVTGSRIPSRVAESSSPVQLSDRVVVSGSRIRTSIAEDHTVDSAAWIQAIEQMLDKGDVAGALREWKKLRETYPDFVAPAPLETRMERLIELND